MLDSYAEVKINPLGEKCAFITKADDDGEVVAHNVWPTRHSFNSMERLSESCMCGPAGLPDSVDLGQGFAVDSFDTVDLKFYVRGVSKSRHGTDSPGMKENWFFVLLILSPNAVRGRRRCQAAKSIPNPRLKNSKRGGRSGGQTGLLRNREQTLHSDDHPLINPRCDSF